MKTSKASANDAPPAAATTHPNPSVREKPDLSIAQDDRWPRGLRSAIGWAISAALVAFVVVRVDGASALQALVTAAPVPMVVALALVVVEVLLRARRWQILLRFQHQRHVPYAIAARYLCVGYFANTLLPARLGDVARAYLTARDQGIPRLATFGTIVVERIADAGLIIVAVLVFAQSTASASTFSGPAVMLLLAGTVGAVAGVGSVVAWRTGLIRPPGPLARCFELVDRIAAGARALRSPRRSAVVGALTVSAFGVAILEFWMVAGGVGIRLSFVEAGIVMGVLALSTAVPAAPGSLGTYEVAGVAILTQLGAAPAPALAAVVLMHVIATLPPAIAGLVAFVRTQVSVADLRAGARMEPDPA